VVLLCAAAALAVPAVAAAKPKPEVQPGGFLLEIPLPESNGWRMELAAENHRQISLIAARGAMVVRYRVTGRASSRLLKADFGPLGQVDVKLNLEADPLLPPFMRKRERRDKRCRGKEPVEMLGGFHGTVDFDGEERVAGVFTRNGPAAVRRWFRTVCRPKPKKSSKGNRKKRSETRDVGIEIDLLAARAHGGGRTTSWEAFGLKVESEQVFGYVSGSIHERQGRVKVSRSAAEFAESPQLVFGPSERKVETAKVKPPKPFTGRAFYVKKPGSLGAWTGDLAVRLPEAGDIQLAGPEFKAKLCRAADFAAFGKVLRCLLEIQALDYPGSAAAQLRDLYGSGSHSQPLALARLSSLR
jgi:hypothetical protein